MPSTPPFCWPGAMRSMQRALALLILGSAKAWGDGNCFKLLDRPVASQPFTEGEVRKLVQYFQANLNINGTGAVIASPGDVPALKGCCPGGYRYHWMRDGALSMAAMLQLSTPEAQSQVEGLEAMSPDYMRETLQSYANWVSHVHDSWKSTDDMESAFTEPKWEIATCKPYAGGWCRPQTDGPALRAQTLLMAANMLEDLKFVFWGLAKLDLDWLARSDGSNVKLSTCDLWEETIDPNFLWNRAAMRAALLQGHAFASEIGDTVRAELYLASADTFVQDPFQEHTESLQNGGYATECPAENAGQSCQQYQKEVDGATILSIQHQSPVKTSVYNASKYPPPLMPSSLEVARTVQAYNQIFCSLYPVNGADTNKGVPGVLYGRYKNDVYGGGNPWVLISASLASVFYQAAQAVASGVAVSHDAVSAWAAALNDNSFQGTGTDFLRAGDSVLVRIHSHIAAQDDMHLYEQIDKQTGAQYNAKDITWSYAEVLTALLERGRAVDALRFPTFL